MGGHLVILVDYEPNWLATKVVTSKCGQAKILEC